MMTDTHRCRVHFDPTSGLTDKERVRDYLVAIVCAWWLLPICATLGAMNWVGFLYIAARGKCLKWVKWAGVYAGVTILTVLSFVLGVNNEKAYMVPVVVIFVLFNVFGMVHLVSARSEWAFARMEQRRQKRWRRMHPETKNKND